MNYMESAKRANSDDEYVNRKRCRQEKSCVIHCTDDNTDLIIAPQNNESWKTLVKAAVIRKHQPLIAIAETTNEDEIPDIVYHRKCRGIFTMKKLLERHSSPQLTDLTGTTDTTRRSSIPQSPSTSITYEHVCIYCEKKSKFNKLTSLFYASVLLLTINFVITLSK